MKIDLFKALGFLVLAVVCAVGRLLNLSVISNGLTIAFAAVWMILAIVFFVKYKRGKKQYSEPE